MFLEKLEGRKGILRILVFVYEHGETNFQKIIDESDLYDRIVRSNLPILKGAGLISTRIDSTSYPHKNMISLTEKGKKIAEKLKEVEVILGGMNLIG